MKKILLVIILFFCCINVYALERSFAGFDSTELNGISYYKYKDGVYYFKNAKEIKDTATGNTAYCLEPFIDLVDYSTYSTSNGQFGLSNAMWDKVKLISYYGYGYKNHTNKKWVSITQMVIWRTLYPNYKFEWVDQSANRNVIHPYDKEIKELNELVSSHYKIPTIEENIKTDINSTLILEDQNNVLKHYKIISSDFDARIEDNKLIVNAKEEKIGEIVLERASKTYNNDFLFFTKSGSQSLIERGNIKPITYKINIVVESGSIKVTKVDKDTDLIDPQGDASLDGAVYEIYDENMNLVASKMIENNLAVFEDLEYGKYFVKEKSAGTGYYVDSDSYEVNIDSNMLEQNVRLGNFVIKSKITIIKNYGSLEDFNNNKMRREKNIVFNVYDKNNTLVFSGITDSNGEITFELPYGEYTIKQMNTTDGYKKTDDYHLVIDENNNLSETIVFNDFKVVVPNAGVYTGVIHKVIKSLFRSALCTRLFCFLY